MLNLTKYQAQNLVRGKLEPHEICDVICAIIDEIESDYLNEARKPTEAETQKINYLSKWAKQHHRLEKLQKRQKKKKKKR